MSTLIYGTEGKSSPIEKVNNDFHVDIVTIDRTPFCQMHECKTTSPRGHTARSQALERIHWESCLSIGLCIGGDLMKNSDWIVATAFGKDVLTTWVSLAYIMGTFVNKGLSAHESGNLFLGYRRVFV